MNLCPEVSCRAEPLPWMRTAPDAACCMRRFTVRAASGLIFPSSPGCSPLLLLMPSNRCAYSPGQSYTSSIALSPTFNLCSTLPTATPSVIALIDSFFWCGSSKVWSRRVNLPDVWSCTFVSSAMWSSSLPASPWIFL